VKQSRDRQFRMTGHYVARATPVQAQSLLARADPGKALDAFNALCGPYATTICTCS